MIKEQVFGLPFCYEGLIERMEIISALLSHERQIFMQTISMSKARFIKDRNLPQRQDMGAPTKERSKKMLEMLPLFF